MKGVTDGEEKTNAGFDAAVVTAADVDVSLDSGFRHLFSNARGHILFRNFDLPKGSA